MISPMSALGEVRFMRHEGSVGATFFRDFPKGLLKAYIEDLNGRLKLVYLSP